MTWVRLESDSASHPKVASLSDSAFRMWVNTISWCSQHGTDGVIRKTVPLSSISPVRHPRKAIEEMIEHDLLLDEETHWRVHDYLDYQLPASYHQDRKEVDRERKRVARATRNGKHE